ncbi:putative reverse transcriptase zinc-binding domain-containing protein [Arabidopsis thaliana]
MEVFSKFMHSRFESGSISYHPNTSELNISHLMFADDVMIFCDGSSSSLHEIYETLDDFAGWSIREISAYGFPEGSLHVRYLGLPLMSRKLKISEYSPLLDKIKGKFRNWAVKSLSFAGRTQLIASVIYGTINFWMSTFSLLKGCIRMIESICSRFLWSGNIESSSKAKVSWSSVCLPKSEGGLGLRSLSAWNNNLCLRLIWLLFSGSGSLWSWDSLLWRLLLKLRHLAAQFIKCKVRNGKKAWFWYDNWTPLGPLYGFFGDHGPRSLRVPILAKVADTCNDNGWKMAAPRSDLAESLQIHLSSTQPPASSSGVDTFAWEIDGKSCNGFFLPSKPGRNYGQEIQKKLPTKSRLASLGLDVSTTCSLCSGSFETRDHLFHHCAFTSIIWDKIMIRIGHPAHSFSDWNSILHWAQVQSIASPKTLRLLIIHSLVYLVWRQRNNFIHNQIYLSPTAVFKELDRLIINTITARRHLKNFRHLMALWLH